MKTYNNTRELVKIYLFILVLTMTLAFMAACSEQKVKNGKDGVGCTVVQLTNGAEIKCGDTTSAVILNGQDGSDLEPGPYTVIEMVNPCGTQSASDEVLLRLFNNQLLAHYSHGNEQYLTLVGPGNYVTTDGTKCAFTVHTDGSVTWE